MFEGLQRLTGGARRCRRQHDLWAPSSKPRASTKLSSRCAYARFSVLAKYAFGLAPDVQRVLSPYPIRTRSRPTRASGAQRASPIVERNSRLALDLWA